MVEVFKTNIHDQTVADSIINDLHLQVEALRINFDLDDCDKILRIESNDNVVEKVHHFLKSQGYLCEVLED